MPFTLDPTRWEQIESLPLSAGVGDPKHGLCVVARLVYAATGEVSDAAKADCIAPTIRAYLISLNDALPTDLRQRLGTLELAERVLAADTSPATEQRRAFICADHAVRVSAVAAHCAAYAARDAAYAACDALDAARNAADAAHNAARNAHNAARNAAYAALADRSGLLAVHGAALAADAARDAALAWEPAFQLLDALLAA